MEHDNKYNEILTFFNLESLRDHQMKGIDALCAGNDVYIGTKTGGGKSLIYHSIPVIAPDAIVLVIAPLVSIMKEQCDKLCALGLKATYIGKDTSENDMIASGHYNFIYGSPEALVGEKKWKQCLSDLGDKLRLLVVDEAHTVIQWGEPKEHEAFREKFSSIGEIRAVNPKMPVLALTATSAPSQRRRIMKSLCFKSSSVIITESPNRENIKISALCIPNNTDIEEAFDWILKDFDIQRENYPRHVIFSESISDVSKIYACFRKKIGPSDLFEMYHSKTVESKKEIIREDMGQNGKIRILMCTNAAGMGVNFVGVYNIVHYGLPREMDTFVQQMGRAGRDGVYSHELIIYKCHKGHLKKVDEELVKLVKDSKCRREVLCSSYGCEVNTLIPLHRCCDICEQKCVCKSEDCPLSHPASQNKEYSSSTLQERPRDVSESDLISLRHKLKSLQWKLSDFSSIVNPNLIHGLSDEVIDYIVKNVQHLYTPNDVLKSCAVWSYDISLQIANIIQEVFCDDACTYYDSDSDCFD